MRKVTADQVRDAMIATSITTVASHKCAECGEEVCYRREGDRLFFDLSCGCRRSDPLPLEWEAHADNINAIDDPEFRRVFAARFGLVLGPLIDPERNGHGALPDFNYLKDGLAK